MKSLEEALEEELGVGEPDDPERAPDAPEVRIHETVLVPIAKIRPNRWNPNVQDPAVFNALVEHIVEVGFTGSVALRPLSPEEQEGPYEYEIVDGEHRYKAALVLGMTEIPATVHPEWEEDKAKAETVAFNVLTGHLDPLKFTQLFNGLARKYGEDAAKSMMSFADEALFNRTYRRVKDSLPPDMQQKLARSKAEIKTIDDLSVVLHEMMRKYGNTVEYSYIWFRYGGKTHLMLQMDYRTKRHMEEVANRAADTQTDVNQFFSDVLHRGMKAWYGERVGEQPEPGPDPIGDEPEPGELVN